MADDMNERRVDLASLRIDDRARAGNGGSRRVVVGGVIAAVLLAVIAAVLLLRGRPAEVEAVAARPAGDAQATALLNASGYVTPRRRATVAAKITARVVDMLADEGMRVKEGQLLARLDDSDALKALAVARATLQVAQANVPVVEVNLANAERELKRQLDLQRDGVATVQALDLARTTRDGLKAQLAAARDQVREANAVLAEAQQNVDNCLVRAPFDGIVVSKDAQPGEMVSPISAGSGFTRTGIATVVDMKSLEIEVDVNESYIAKVTAGQRVDAVLDAYPDWHIPASVRTVIPTADRQKATVKVRISFDALDPRILPDMGVKVAFLAEPDRGTKAPVARALIPRAAVRDEGGRPIVFLVVDGRAERRVVTLGNDRGTDVEVLAGVNEGDRVIVGGPEKLADGQRVKVK
jgi:RND family efflux transporter MFP subunit